MEIFGETFSLPLGVWFVERELIADDVDWATDGCRNAFGVELRKMRNLNFLQKVDNSKKG